MQPFRTSRSKAATPFRGERLLYKINFASHYLRGAPVEKTLARFLHFKSCAYLNCISSETVFHIFDGQTYEFAGQRRLSCARRTREPFISPVGDTKTTEAGPGAHDALKGKPRSPLYPRKYRVNVHDGIM